MKPSFRVALAALALVVLAARSAADGLPAKPAPDDQSVAALVAYQSALRESLGGRDRDVPLERKAEHYEWLLERYHWTENGTVTPRIQLAQEPGQPARHRYGADVSTWNGALLAALGHRYAATRDPATLARIAELLEGLRLYQEVTETPGLVARVVLREPEHKAKIPYVAPDGSRYFYRADPAKGTYNQLGVGYATLWMTAYDDLPAAARERARDDVAALVGHLVENDYRIRGLDGEQTPYGYLDPRWAFVRLPFNAQVSTMLVATARRYTAGDGERGSTFERAWRELRDEHVYWNPRWIPPFFPPQRVSKSRFLGYNDLNHVVNAAFVVVALELEAARRDGREPDWRFVHDMGQTLRVATKRLGGLRNALCNLMWVALASDAAVLDAIAGDDAEEMREELAGFLDVAVEQLRRFPIDRIIWEGRQREEDEPQWVDDYRPDSYHWKVRPEVAWDVTGGPTDSLRAGIDYLHAYWLFRHYGLDAHPVARERHGRVVAAARSR